MVSCEPVRVVDILGEQGLDDCGVGTVSRLERESLMRRFVEVLTGDNLAEEVPDENVFDTSVYIYMTQIFSLIKQQSDAVFKLLADNCEVQIYQDCVVGESH